MRAFRYGVKPAAKAAVPPAEGAAPAVRQKRTKARKTIPAAAVADNVPAAVRVKVIIPVIKIIIHTSYSIYKRRASVCGALLFIPRRGLSVTENS